MSTATEPAHTQTQSQTPGPPKDYQLVQDNARRVRRLQFGILSPERILADSVCEVLDGSLYVRQLPKPGGINDLRMGTSDWLMNCSTCRNNVMKCVGHPGHISLQAPMYHTGYLNTLVKVLRCVCFWCSGFLVEVDAPKLRDQRFLQSTDKSRLSLISAIAKTKRRCHHCGAPQPAKYTKAGNGIKHAFDKHMRVCKPPGNDDEAEDGSTCEYDDNGLHVCVTAVEDEWARQPLDATRVRSTLSHISDATCQMIGLNPECARPEWMVLTVLVVPPPIIRPSIKHSDDSRMRGQDDLTIHLQEIVKVNIKLRDAQKAAEEPVAKNAKGGELGESTQSGEAPDAPDSARLALVHALRDELQVLIGCYVHHESKKKAVGGAANSGSGPPHNNREKRLFHKRLRGKKGRIRGTLSGKRVNFCARSVVSPDPTGDIDEVGVPLQIANVLTMPVRVTSLNLKDLKARVSRGPGVLHGAANVVEPDGTVRNLKLIEDRDSLDIRVGWIVHRHMQNDDIVMFNRQPSLHKMSIMGHRVRLVDGKSFRLPICDTTAYNADFDGDE